MPEPMFGMSRARGGTTYMPPIGSERMMRNSSQANLNAEENTPESKSKEYYETLRTVGIQEARLGTKHGNSFW